MEPADRCELYIINSSGPTQNGHLSIIIEPRQLKETSMGETFISHSDDNICRKTNPHLLLLFGVTTISSIDG